MNAPLIELVIRSANAVLATVTVMLLVEALRVAKTYPMPILKFLTGVMVITAVWRWFLLFLGFQNNPGEFGFFVQWIQPMNASVTFLLYLSIALLAWYHTRMRKVPGA